MDELGFIAVDKAGGQLLFQLVSDLYEQVSMIITSNLRFGDWNSIFAESTIPQLNTLFNNPDEENGTEIEVSDPTHPLFGHRFALISVSSPLHGPGSAFVSYREYMVLRLPVASTTLALSRPVISTKLTPDAIKELLTIAEDCEALNALSPKPNLEAPAPRTATLYQRRTLDHPAGGTL